MEHIAVHRIHLDLPEEILARLALTLSPDEQQRAARFRFERHRRRFTAARGALRAILGAALGLPPAAVALVYGEHGKPALQGGSAGLSFNLSHSDDWGLCALAGGRILGVDLEPVRPLDDMEALANRFYSVREAAALRALPEEERPPVFFRAWTCKEAYVKATGRGLGFSTRLIEVGLDGPPGLLAVAGDPAEAARWKIALPPVVPGFAAAICAEGHDWEPRVVDWAP